MSSVRTSHELDALLHRPALRLFPGKKHAAILVLY
jgi:hypothetical protein